MSKYSLSIICSGLILGVLYALYFGVTLYTIALTILLALVFCVLTILQIKNGSNGKNGSSNHIAYLILFCIILGISIGSLRTYIMQSSVTNEFKAYYDKDMTFVGTVSDYPDVRNDYTFITLSNIESSDKKFNENVLVRVPLYPEYHYGDKLEVSVKLQKPRSTFGTSTTQKFSYKEYLAIKNIYAVASFPKVNKVESAQWSLASSLYKFKDKCIDVVSEHIREPAAGLLLGILFGLKRALADDVLQDFIATGLVHIVVLSGYNIAIIVSAVTKLFGRIPKVLKYFFIYSSIILFTMFVGASSTVIRAGIMAAIALFARQLGREADGLRLLVLAAGLMILYQPKTLLYDPSFQLSFLATLGLIVWTPHIVNKLSFISEKFLLREIMASTIATQMTVVPYILWYMGSVSSIGLVANLLITPFVPIVMLFGFVTLMLGLIYTPLSFPSAVLTSLMLNTIIYVVHVLAMIPGALMYMAIPAYVVFFIYILQIIYLASTVSNLKR